MRKQNTEKILPSQWKKDLKGWLQENHRNFPKECEIKNEVIWRLCNKNMSRQIEKD